MKFLIHYEGAGEGCDYTIGCNHALESMEADSVAKAVKHVLHELIDYDGDSDYDPEELSAITIYALAEPEVSGTVSLDPIAICAERQAKMEAVAAKEREARDRASYEALKARYGPGEAINEKQSA